VCGEAFAVGGGVSFGEGVRGEGVVASSSEVDVDAASNFINETLLQEVAIRVGIYGRPLYKNEMSVYGQVYGYQYHSKKIRGHNLSADYQG